VSRDDSLIDALRSRIRDVPDFPKPGIVFKDITPLLGDAATLRAVIEACADRARGWRPDVVVAIESRGFIFGGALAVELGVGFVPVRKPGKLQSETVRVEYALEYGRDVLEMHRDALVGKPSALVVDDVLATGGTAAATARLIEEQGAHVAGCLFVVELGFLGGRKKLARYAVDSLLAY
jgi:adenine phosphoribosyltransferase